jgi:hypothetical protein
MTEKSKEEFLHSKKEKRTVGRKKSIFHSHISTHFHLTEELSRFFSFSAHTNEKKRERKCFCFHFGVFELEWKDVWKNFAGNCTGTWKTLSEEKNFQAQTFDIQSSS